MTDDSYRAMVRAVADALLEPGELENLEVYRTPATDEVWVRIVVRGDVFEDRVDSPEWDADGVRDPDAPRDRLTDHLSDWIAESRFGWGEQRLPRA